MRNLLFAPGFGRCRRVACSIFFAVVGLLAAGCISAPEEGETKAATTPPQTKPKPVLPLRVRVVVPYAGNMPGMMNYRAPMSVNTGFQVRLGHLIQEINANPAVADRAFYLVDQAVQLNAVPADALRGRVNGTNPAGYGQGIGGADLLRNLLALPSAEKLVTVIATDLVDHIANRRVLAALEDDITSALASLRHGDLSASVYADTSRFYMAAAQKG